MRCHEARRLCGAWLDSELDTQTSLEIEQHLEECAGCRSFFDGERHMEERVARALLNGEKSQGLWARIETQVLSAETRKASSPSGTPFGRWKMLALAAAAAVILAAAIGVWLRSGSLDLAEAAAVDHAKYLAGQMLAEFANEPPADVLMSAAGRLDRIAFTLLPHAPAFQAEGARLCHLKGVPVAWMLGRFEGQPVSVIVLRREELPQFPAVQERLAQGHAIVCGRARGFQFAARAVDGHIVCAIAETSRERLEWLVGTVSHTGAG